MDDLVARKQRRQISDQYVNVGFRQYRDRVRIDYVWMENKAIGFGTCTIAKCP